MMTKPSIMLLDPFSPLLIVRFYFVVILSLLIIRRSFGSVRSASEIDISKLFFYVNLRHLSLHPAIA